jgi:hypothetical protein
MRLTGFRAHLEMHLPGTGRPHRATATATRQHPPTGRLTWIPGHGPPTGPASPVSVACRPHRQACPAGRWQCPAPRSLLRWPPMCRPRPARTARSPPQRSPARTPRRAPQPMQRRRFAPRRPDRHPRLLRPVPGPAWRHLSVRTGRPGRRRTVEPRAAARPSRDAADPHCRSRPAHPSHPGPAGSPRSSAGYCPVAAGPAQPGPLRKAGRPLRSECSPSLGCPAWVRSYKGCTRTLSGEDRG